MLKKLVVVLVFLLLAVSACALRSATCEQDSKCKIGCSGGDKDCTCQNENGFLCSKSQYCPATLLLNRDGVACCSVECKIGSELKDDSSGVFLVDEKNTGKSNEVLPDSFSQREEYVDSSGMGTALIVFLVGLVVFAVLIAVGLHRLPKELNAVTHTIFFVEETFKRMFYFVFGRILRFSYRKEVAAGKPSGKLEMNPLLSNIKSMLQGDSLAVFDLVFKNQGKTFEELLKLSGMETIRFKGALTELVIKQIIAPFEEDSVIEFRDWLRR